MSLTDLLTPISSDSHIAEPTNCYRDNIEAKYKDVAPYIGRIEKDGKPVVYVKTGQRFEERAVKLAKRSESTMVISEGLKPGEIVALANPAGQQGSKKQQKGKSEGGAGPVNALPSGPKS